MKMKYYWNEFNDLIFNLNFFFNFDLIITGLNLSVSLFSFLFFF